MTLSRPKILIVDDKAQNLYTLERLLARLDADVISAASGVDALALTLEHDFSVAIVDVQMPEMDGYELVTLLRGNQTTATMPVIFVSAILSDEYHHRKAYEAGAVDFLSKPFTPEILLSKVKIFLELYQQRQQLEALVDQLNVANDQLLHKAIQLETSSEVGQRATSLLDLDRLLLETVKLIRTRLDYYFVGILLWNEERDTLVVRTGINEQGEPVILNLALPAGLNSITIQVGHSGELYLANDVLNDPMYHAHALLPRTRAELALPLRVRDSVLGVLDIQCDQPNFFDIEDVIVLQTMADQIAVAIRNAQLYHQVKVFNEQLEAKVEERTNELRQAYRQLELLDGNKSDFIAVVSHELRTPLTLIQGYSSIMLTDEEMPRETQRLHLEGINSGVQRMHEIVNLMLDMVRLDNRTFGLSPEPLNIYALLLMFKEALEPALEERNLSLWLNGLHKLPLVTADSEGLNKLFEHLLLNAIKFTPDHGHISIYGRLLEDKSDPHVEVVVKDTGIGIAPESQELIFTKFYQTGEVTFHSSGKTKFKGGGPGLGLAIARGIVEAHKGRIWVESPGHDEEECPGSEFHVVLPVAGPVTVHSLAVERAQPHTLTL